MTTASLTATSKDNIATVKDYFTLLKPTVMSLVVFTGAATFALVPNRPPLLLCLIILLCIALGAGAAGAFNMWFDRDIDTIMVRTRTRPIPRGVIPPEEALSFSIFFMGLAVLLLGLATNWLAAGSLLIAQLIYTHVYTVWLKRRTPHNIVIGGASGALPPLIVWLACGGSLTAILPWALCLIVFLWTPPHFWALALISQNDYRKAALPMYPIVYGDKKTQRTIVIYTILTALSGVSPYWLSTDLSITYLIGSSILGTLFIAASLRLARTQRANHARQVFGFSIVYLFMLFGLMAI